jgi:hypothetical protein
MSMPSFSPRPLVNCPACQGSLKPVGRLPVRRDMAQAGIIVLAQQGDQQPIIGIDAYRCHNCGRLEFYDHDYLLPSS